MSKPIPLYDNDGEVRAYALVDDDMERFLSVWNWRLSPNGYAVRDSTRRSGKRMIRMHRVIVGLDHGDEIETDHINRDRLDNRRENLRLVTRAQNTQNVPARKGYRGVTQHTSGRWIARGSVNRKQVHIGVFDTELEAARAAEQWRSENMPHSIEARLCR